MPPGHEKPDVSQLSIGYVAWDYKMAPGLAGIHRHTRDQWLRARQSIPIPIAIANPIAIPIPFSAIPQVRYNQKRLPIIRHFLARGTTVCVAMLNS